METAAGVRRPTRPRPPVGRTSAFFPALGASTRKPLLPFCRFSARRLLFALRPYLKPERQEKVERALQLARLFRVGKKFLLKGEDHV